MTPTQYNPYSVNFFPNDRFEISFKDQAIVAEGRQRESELIKATVDLLNRAYSEGVHEVKVERDQTISILEAELAERDERIANQVATYTDIVNKYYALREVVASQSKTIESVARTPQEMLADFYAKKSEEESSAGVSEFNSDSPEYEYNQPDEDPSESPSDSPDETLPGEIVVWSDPTSGDAVVWPEANAEQTESLPTAATKSRPKAKPIKRKGK